MGLIIAWVVTSLNLKFLGIANIPLFALVALFDDDIAAANKTFRFSLCALLRTTSLNDEYPPPITIILFWPFYILVDAWIMLSFNVRSLCEKIAEKLE